MARRAKYYRWSARIEKETLRELQLVASHLGFIVTTPGATQGKPSPPDMLDSLAAAYRRDAQTVLGAMRAIGVVANPLPTDAPPSADFLND